MWMWNRPKQRRILWNTPIWFLTVHSFPLHATHFLSSYCRDFSLLQSCCRIPLHLSSAKWRNRFHGLDENVVLGLECKMVGVNVISTTVKHPTVGHVVFFRRAMSNVETIKALYVLPVQIDHSKQLLSVKEYVDGIMAVLINTPNQSTQTLLSRAAERLGVEHSCPIISAPYEATWIIDDAKYLSGGTTFAAGVQSKMGVVLAQGSLNGWHWSRQLLNYHSNWEKQSGVEKCSSKDTGRDYMFPITT